MASTSDFRNGLTFVWNNNIWIILEFQHVKPGKGGAFVRSKLKNLRNGKIVDNTFRSGEKFESARIERQQFQYLYQDDMGLHFMNNETFDQLMLQPENVEGSKYIKEGSTVDILIYSDNNNEPLNVEIPRHVELEVTQTDPGLKGDTATGATKPAQVETGATFYVPLFVNEGDIIRIDTVNGDYLTRVTSK